MTTSSRPPIEQIAVLFARSRSKLGPSGLVGCGLIATATVMTSTAWRLHQSELEEAARHRPPARPSVPIDREPEAIQSLPTRREVPALIKSIEQAAKGAGLGWPRAEYQFNPASSDQPARVEVKCAPVGSYLAVRSFVTTLLQDHPSLTLREFSLTRASTSLPEVDAQLTFVVYIAEDASSEKAP